jgi:hypothetical protein
MWDGPHTAPYGSRTAQELLFMTWHILYGSLERPCYMTLEGAMARHGFMTWHILYGSLERPCYMTLEGAMARHGFMMWHMLYGSLERPCYMTLEGAMARHGSWRHTVACGAQAC